MKRWDYRKWNKKRRRASFTFTSRCNGDCRIYTTIARDPRVARPRNSGGMMLTALEMNNLRSGELMISRMKNAGKCLYCGIVVTSLNRISHDFGTLCPESWRAKGLSNTIETRHLSKANAGFKKPAKL